MTSSWINRTGPKSSDPWSDRRGEGTTDQRRRRGEDAGQRGRDWKHASRSEPPEGTQAAAASTADGWSPEPGEHPLLWLPAIVTVMCYGCPGTDHTCVLGSVRGTVSLGKPSQPLTSYSPHLGSGERHASERVSAFEVRLTWARGAGPMARPQYQALADPRLP